MNKRVFEELTGIVRQRAIWLSLGVQDIAMRYRRSSLGPFWITLSTAVTIYAMGFLYGHLFHMDLQVYFPYLACGIISWGLISTIINDSVNTFVEAENYIKNVTVSFSVFTCRVILRNLIIFAHNLIVFVPIVLMFHLHVGWQTLMIIPGLFIICVNAFFWGTCLAILGARFRDLMPIVGSIVQIVFFVTPIMWMESTIASSANGAKYLIFINLNPAYQFLNLVRNPMLGEPQTFLGLSVVAAVTVAGFFLYSLLIGKYKRRIVFWL